MKSQIYTLPLTNMLPLESEFEKLFHFKQKIICRIIQMFYSTSSYQYCFYSQLCCMQHVHNAPTLHCEQKNICSLKSFSVHHVIAIWLVKLAGRQILRIDDQFSEEHMRALAGFFVNQSLSNELCDGHRQKALNFLLCWRHKRGLLIGET